MNKLLFPLLLAACAGSAFTQSVAATASDGKAKTDKSDVQIAAEKSADSFCMRETGSHLRAITNEHNKRAVECAKGPGRAYTREDIERTGATTTADALRRLDPSIH